ncbi:hypothetical protein EAO70_15005 [Streptomyces sp. adm13(2018)]|uniref:hypothetical protein n=1 Tax=Streptomyces sp. adm13(2018) TaxID=2479007 RepID=UPI0011CDAA11|nr:hypothetical protein [Streptomyces sp. adm13(2018)]TXS16647.1 hypothetical protein EAO70_15005 [Streptomyces sp. adm13(2018)]
MPPKLASTIEALGAESRPEMFDEFVRAIGGSLSDLVGIRHNAEGRTDLSEATVSELRTAVEALLQGAGESVLVAWPADRVAARIRVALLLESIDDLWYPAMDDLVVLTDEPEPTVVVLDHEEQLTCTRIRV